MWAHPTQNPLLWPPERGVWARRKWLRSLVVHCTAVLVSIFDVCWLAACLSHCTQSSMVCDCVCGMCVFKAPRTQPRSSGRWSSHVLSLTVVHALCVWYTSTRALSSQPLPSHADTVTEAREQPADVADSRGRTRACVLKGSDPGRARGPALRLLCRNSPTEKRGVFFFVFLFDNSTNSSPAESAEAATSDV